jgi:hypothetical protein
MSHQLLSAAGLIANMAGVVVLFFYGFPQPTHDEQVAIAVTAEPHEEVKDGKKAAEVMQEARQRKKFYLSMSVVALILMLVGFGAQLAALWF